MWLAYGSLFDQLNDTSSILYCRHQMNILLIRLEDRTRFHPEDIQVNQTVPFDIDKSEYKCSVCDVKCNGVKQLETHLLGKKHLSRVSAKQIVDDLHSIASITDKPNSQLTQMARKEYVQSILSDAVNILSEQLREFKSRCQSRTLIIFCPPSSTITDINCGQELYNRAEEEVLQNLCFDYSDEGHALIRVVSWKSLSECYGVNVKDIQDPTLENIAHQPYSEVFYGILAVEITRSIHASFIYSRKVLVLDCDHTLWSGAVGELGPENIEIRQEHLKLMEIAAKMQQRGVLICLSSKNIEQDVRAVFQHRENLPLTINQILLIKASWNPKHEIVKEISEQLDLPLDTFLFVDDNPAEIAQMRHHCPTLLSICISMHDLNHWVPDSLKSKEYSESHSGDGYEAHQKTQELLFAQNLIETNHTNPSIFSKEFIQHLWCFDSPWLLEGLSNTEEDSQRTQLYREHLARIEAQKHAVSNCAFLASLNLRIDIVSPQLDHVSRIAQLMCRTTQFNVSGCRMQENEICNMILNPMRGSEIWVTYVADRFGFYGLVGATTCLGLRLLIHTSESVGYDSSPLTVAIISTFILSCRVLERGVEHEMLKKITQSAQHFHADGLLVYYNVTNRNLPAQRFLNEIGGIDLGLSWEVHDLECELHKESQLEVNQGFNCVNTRSLSATQKLEDVSRFENGSLLENKSGSDKTLKEETEECCTFKKAKFCSCMHTKPTNRAVWIPIQSALSAYFDPQQDNKSSSQHSNSQTEKIERKKAEDHTIMTISQHFVCDPKRGILFQPNIYQEIAKMVSTSTNLLDWPVLQCYMTDSFEQSYSFSMQNVKNRFDDMQKRVKGKLISKYQQSDSNNVQSNGVVNDVQKTENSDEIGQQQGFFRRKMREQAKFLMKSINNKE